MIQPHIFKARRHVTAYLDDWVYQEVSKVDNRSALINSLLSAHLKANGTTIDSATRQTDVPQPQPIVNMPIEKLLKRPEVMFPCIKCGESRYMSRLGSDGLPYCPVHLH